MSGETAPGVVRPRLGLRPSPYGKYQSKIGSDQRFRENARDRAAYAYITGAFPTHLRERQNDFIRTITTVSRSSTSLDGNSGRLRIGPDIIDDLQLEVHPMMALVRRKLNEGWSVRLARMWASRRPYSKVYLFRQGAGGMESITVQLDGSTKEGWD